VWTAKTTAFILRRSNSIPANAISDPTSSLCQKLLNKLHNSKAV